MFLNSCLVFKVILDSWIARFLAAGKSSEVEALQRWAGVPSISFDDMPIIGHMPGRENIVCSGGWGGAGNVLGFVGGELVADMLGGNDAIPREFASARISSQLFQ